MPEQRTCPSLPELNEFLLGQVSEQDTEEFQRHIKECARCQSALGAAKAEDTLVEAMRAQAARSGHDADSAIIDELMARLSSLPPATTNRTVDFTPGDEGDAPAPATSIPTVPGYEILGVLGRGGMGVVYRARHLALKRIVALKMISAGGHAGPAERARFKVEAESVARLQHPHVVQIYEVGEADGLPYCALEYVNGGSLAQRLDGTPLPPDQAAANVEILARAMHAAHQAGVIHRDLKPANVLLARNDERGMMNDERKTSGSDSAVHHSSFILHHSPKITDFGLARNLDEAGQTQTGSIMGTPSYMAPEQAEGRAHAIGPAADVYALGAILYECLTGRPPFRAATTMDTLHQVIRDEPVPPRQLQSKTPRDLETICLKCLHKEPGKRYGGALELALDLQRFLANEPIQARPVGRIERGIRWCKRNPRLAWTMSAAVVFLVAGAGFSIYYAVEADQKAGLASEKQRAAELSEREANWSDYVARFQLFGRAAAEGEFGQLQHLMEKADARPGLRPFQGWEWAYLREQCQRASRELKGTGDYRGTAAWCRATGRIAAATQDRTIDIWDPSTSKIERTLPAGTSGVIRVAWHPDGKRLAVSYEERELCIWDADSGKLLHTLDGHSTHEQALAWSHDGKRLASGGYEGLLKIWDADAGRLLRTMTANRGKGPLDVMHVYSVSWHPDGVRIAAAHRYGELFVWNAQTAKPEFIRRAGVNRRVDWSPDGKLLAAGAANAILIFNDKGDEVMSLRDYPGGNALRWGPDGSRLAAAARDQVRVWDIRSAELIDTLRVHGSGMLLTVDWSPTGDRILSGTPAVRVGVGPLRIATVGAPVAAATSLQVTGKDQPIRFAWSPEGERLAVAIGGKKAEVAILDVRTGKRLARLALPHSGYEAACFSPDGRTVAVAGYHNIWVCDAATGKLLRTLFDEPTAGIQFVQWSPDGRWLATSNYVKDTLIWDAATWKVSDKKVNDGLPFSHLAWSPDSGYLAAGNAGGTLRVWDVSQREKLWTASFGSRGMSWSADSRLFVSLSAGLLPVFDARSGKIVHQFEIPANGASWSGDGHRIAFAANDGVRVYDAATADLLLTLPSKGFGVGPLAWSPNSRRLAAVCSDGAVRVWGSADMPAMTPAALETGLLARAASAPPADAPPAEPATLPIEKFFEEHFAGANAPVASAGQPFVIVRGNQPAKAGYGNLADAVKAAKSGDTIEIRGNGPFVTPAVNAGKKALAIRAGAGFEPVLLIDAKSLEANLPLLTSNGPLTLDGLQFRHVEVTPNKETFYYLVRCNGALLSVSHCRFFVTSKRLATALLCWNSPRSEVRHCEFAGNSHGAISWGGLTSFNELEVAGCLCWGPSHFVFFDHYPPAVPRDISLRLYRNTSVGWSALLHYYLRLPEPPPTGDPTPFRIDARENVFDAAVVFAPVVHASGKFQPEVDQPLLPRCFSWHDDKNIYAGSLLQLRHHPGKYVDAIKTLPEWRSYWRQGNTGSQHARPRFHGGDVRALKAKAPDKLTAADFRLYPGSPGQGAAANGRDLGADVDQVGPRKK